MSLDYNTAIGFIQSIPEGRWTTYGDVADAAGNRDAALRIGEWLRDSGGSIRFYSRVINSRGEVPAGFVASTPGLPHNPVEARDKLAAEGVTFEGERAGEQHRYTIEQWRAAGCPSGTEAAAADRLAELETYVEHRTATLPGRLEDLVTLAGAANGPGDAVAVNRAIIARSADDIRAHIRLGRAYQDLRLTEYARAASETVAQLDPRNAIASKRLRELKHAGRGS